MQHVQTKAGQPLAVLIVQRQLDNWRQGAPKHDNPVTGLGKLTESRVKRYSVAMIDRRSDTLPSNQTRK